MVQIEANKKIAEMRRKERAMFDYKQAMLMMYAFNAPKQFPKANDVYGFLEESNKKHSADSAEQEVEKEKPKEITAYRQEEDKAYFMAMAESVKLHNEREERKKRGESINGYDT